MCAVPRIGDMFSYLRCKFVHEHRRVGHASAVFEAYHLSAIVRNESPPQLLCVLIDKVRELYGNSEPNVVRPENKGMVRVVRGEDGIDETIACVQRRLDGGLSWTEGRAV